LVQLYGITAIQCKSTATSNGCAFLIGGPLAHIRRVHARTKEKFMPANRKEIVQRINEAFAENNLEKVLSFCTNDFTWTMVGDTTVRGKDAIRKWMASMNPQPPQFTVQQTIAEGDSVVTRGDMMMQATANGPAIPYTFCDIYRFSGDQVAELNAFVIRTDNAGAGDKTSNEARQMTSAR
jgi:uncharacterized protein (TIGR02246 family)